MRKNSNGFGEKIYEKFLRRIVRNVFWKKLGRNEILNIFQNLLLWLDHKKQRKILVSTARIFLCEEKNLRYVFLDEFLNLKFDRYRFGQEMKWI